MPTPRKELIEPEEVGLYHCISRCVRRAFLCGVDKFSGRSFEHRREWIEARLAHLAQYFAIELVAYAVLSNHVHTVARIRPDIAAAWDDEEVAVRWLSLFPKRDESGNIRELESTDILPISSDKERVKELRTRLSSLSWFNRCLNENIARRANREDGCKGRFWEGRFKSQKIEDLSGLVACAVYVDLNPIRAGMASSPEKSDFTSVKARIEEHKRQKQKRKVKIKVETKVKTKKQEETKPNKGISPERDEKYLKSPLVPLLTIEEATHGDLSELEYLKLVDETGRILLSGKGAIPKKLLPILERLETSEPGWLEVCKNLSRCFKRAIGTASSLVSRAEEEGREWLHGMNAAREIFAGSQESG